MSDDGSLIVSASSDNEGRSCGSEMGQEDGRGRMCRRLLGTEGATCGPWRSGVMGHGL